MQICLHLFIGFCSLLFLFSCGKKDNVSITNDRNATISSVANQGITLSSILQSMETGRYVEGEVIVKFKDGHRVTGALHRATGATVIRRFTMIPEIEVIRLPHGMSVKEGIIKYMSDPSVEYAEPNYIKKITIIPDDTYFNQQWALFNTGQFGGTPNSDLKAPDAWDINTGSRDIVIAILDTGMDYNHTDLINNRWINEAEVPSNGIDDDGNGKIDDRVGWDFTTCAKFNPITGRCETLKPQDNDPMDENSHGTHVAGIIGASGNNSTGIAGLMWNVRLMPLKILNADGEGSIADEISAIDYAVMMKNRGVDIKAINASFGGGVYSASEFDAVSRVNNAGIIFVTAAGNGGDDGIGDNNDLTPSYPGNYNLPNIISVAATDQNDHLASFSNYGPNTVHVAAPGVHILSIIPGGLYYYSGTSMATPYVTGVIGLLYSEYSGFSPSQIKATILRYVDTPPSLAGKIKSGGRLNAYKAMSSLLSPTGLSANNVSSNSVSLQWIDRAKGEDGYRLERKTGNGTYSIISTLPQNSVSYTDTTVNDGLSYSYRVKAFNDIAESESNEISVVTPLNPPSNLSVSVGITEAVLTWTDNSSSEEGFRIERKAGDGNFMTIATLGPNITTYIDNNLQPSMTYTYRVSAYNSIAGDSTPVQVTVTTGSQTGGGTSSGSGGGGCSIVASGYSGADVTLLMGVLAFYLMRRLRKGSD